jgi:hypothetical protein
MIDINKGAFYMDMNEARSTNRLLRVVVALLLRGKGDESVPLRQQIEVLDDLRLRPTEIAEIIGRNSNYVNKELAGIRKSKK